VVAIEEAWNSTHKPLLLKPVALQTVTPGCLGLTSKADCSFKLSDEGDRLVYQRSGGGGDPNPISLKDVKKVYVFSPRNFAIYMHDYDSKASSQGVFHFHCPHVVTHSDWAVHKMWLES
jgi:hypothetical protein